MSPKVFVTHAMNIFLWSVTWREKWKGKQTPWDMLMPLGPLFGVKFVRIPRWSDLANIENQGETARARFFSRPVAHRIPIHNFLYFQKWRPPIFLCTAVPLHNVWAHLFWTQDSAVHVKCSRWSPRRLQVFFTPALGSLLAGKLTRWNILFW